MQPEGQTFHGHGERRTERPCRGGAANAAPENGEQSVQARRAKPSTATENRTRDKRATEKL